MFVGDNCLHQIIIAIDKLSLKVDNIGEKRLSFVQFAKDEGAIRELHSLQTAENIIQLTESTKLLEWFYDETTVCAVVRCLPCFQLELAAKEALRKLSPFQAQQLLSKTCSGTLAGMILMKKETSKSDDQGPLSDMVQTKERMP